MRNSLTLICAVIAIFLVSLPSWSNERTIAPIITTDWLLTHIEEQNLIILDVRAQSAYDTSHIPGAINEPFIVPNSSWIVIKNDLLLELPEESDLFNTLSSLGIAVESKIVVVSAPNPNEPPHFGMAAATRVADTLIYAGVKNVALLDGGFGKWLKEDKPVSAEPVTPNTVSFSGEANTKMFVSQTYVLRNAWRTRLVDARDADVYFGATLENFAAKPGHIFSAVSLPAPWAYITGEDNDFQFKSTDVLEQMAEGVLGPIRSKHSEIIVYCGVGGYASVWWFLLHEVLGYERVKFYDGSAQEWVIDYDMVPYRWY